ncbi:MAG: glycosyltransferase [Dehalococcoidia bacterium]|nr:glycosyltransferase [Dehalococcoidia bacterium]
MKLAEAHVSPEPLDRFTTLLGVESVDHLRRLAAEVGSRAHGQSLWNVNSTMRGGGVAEMLESMLPYVRGLDIDARWVVIEGEAEFFAITKRIHNALHGRSGDGSPLGPQQRRIYEDVLADNARELAAVVGAGDVVILHDPQTAGLIPHMSRAGALVIWRSHIGTDKPNEESALAWQFLLPYVTEARAYVFSRRSFIPTVLDSSRCFVIAPSIDPFSTKNAELDASTTRSILAYTGLVEGPQPGSTAFTRSDGTPGRVDRRADIIRLGPAPSADSPLIVQVSRWDRLKDPVGVMQGFALLPEAAARSTPQLVLAGPNVSGVADDPEGADVFKEVHAEWRKLPHSVRQNVHLASLPLADLEENAAIVNALQRHATVVVQKSVEEGFGLTVAEALWKSRPVIAGAVGGIKDQISDGVNGLLLERPTDHQEFVDKLTLLLGDATLRERLGRAGRQTVIDRFLPTRHIAEWLAMVAMLFGHPAEPGPGPGPPTDGG